MLVPSTTIPFTCPRCGHIVEERLYGPCDGCREQLRAIDRLAKPDTVHFKPAQRMMGEHYVEFTPCGRKSCKRPACKPD